MIRITSFDDLRIAPYRNLKDRELARDGERFIAEGELILRRLLASDYPVESVLLAERRVEELGSIIPSDVPLYVAPETILRQIIGYKFQSGVIAVGRRKRSLWLEDIAANEKGRSTVVILPEIASAENMGSLIRIAAAFGADALILGERSCDPFWRQSIRVSMGTIFSLPLVRSQNVIEDMRRLRERWGYELVASVLDPSAEPLNRAMRKQRLGILFGNEAQGLDPSHLAACDRRITIPMRTGIDSLNVAVAAGIFLNHFTREM